jgi:hypothetical protein
MKWLIVVATSVATLPILAQTQSTPSAKDHSGPPGIQLVECTVYTVDKTASFDCLAKARAACPDDTARCELPIGYDLTDGQDLDRNRRTWEKVRVRFKCGAKVVTRGPHFQNDHAAMVLTCIRAA